MVILARAYLDRVRIGAARSQVEGGGIVVLLIRTLPSLRALYTMTMDIHARYRTARHHSVEPRFNERFLLSFSSLSNFLSVDDELNVVCTSALGY